MKKIKITLLVLLLALFTTLCFTTKVNAEEDTSSSEPTTEDVVEENVDTELEDIVVEDEVQPSDLQVWFEENLGWVVGIPTGMLTTIISIALFVHKTKKKFDELTEDTSSQNKNTKAHLKATVELVTEAKKQNEIISNKIESFIENNASQIAALTSALETMTKAYEASTRKIAALEEVIEMMALHTKELVANGTAEKITQKIRG